jgi:DNA mismatch repair protein MutL
MPPIRQLSGYVEQRIRTGVSLHTPSHVVVELVANALDADARSVVVRLDAASLSVTCEDDGLGMSPGDLEHLGLSYCTSKLRSVQELDAGLHTLGFRGEALASVAAQSVEVVVTSRATNSFETWTKAIRGGKTVQLAPSPVQLTHSGTIVCARNFLHNQPIRQREFLRSARWVFHRQHHPLGDDLDTLCPLPTHMPCSIWQVRRGGMHRRAAPIGSVLL